MMVSTKLKKYEPSVTITMSHETDVLMWGNQQDAAVALMKNKRSFSLLALSCLVFGILTIAVVCHSRAPSPTASDPDEPVMMMGSLAKPRYKATQFLSFTINTMGGLADHGECEGRDVDDNGVCYLGDRDIRQDLTQRAIILEEVLEKLKHDVHKKHPEIDHSNDVLKILAMPEFYWRGPYGAYSSKDLFGDDENVGLLIQLSDTIKPLIQDEAFTNYLFFFGTVLSVGSTSTDPNMTREQKLDATKLVYANFCPVYKGGTESHYSYLVTKRYISDADFLNREILPNPRNFDVSEYKHNDFSDRLNNLFEERGAQIVNDNVLHVDGIKIGMEICLDHRLGALWDNLQKNHNSQLVDVQVIASGGMAIERGPNPVVPGGVVYLSDGEASSAACMRSDEGEFDPDKVCRSVGPKGRKHLPHGGKKYSEFFTLSGCLQMMEGSDLFEGYYSIFQTQGCAYTLKQYGIDVLDKFEYYPPSIEIYPTVNLPE